MNPNPGHAKKYIAATTVVLTLLVCALSFQSCVRNSSIVQTPPPRPPSGAEGSSSLSQAPVQSPSQAEADSGEPAWSAVTAANVDPGDAAGTASTNEGQLSESALQQIAALQREKAARTPIQNKIDSQLLAADRMRRGVPIAEGTSNLMVGLDHDAAGRVLVDIKAVVSEPLLGEINKLGGEVMNRLFRMASLRRPSMTSPPMEPSCFPRQQIPDT